MLPEMIGPVRSKQYKTKSPDFVMAGRLDELTNFKTPAPNKFKLPEIIGSTAKNVYANRAPIYSMYIVYLFIICNRMYLINF